ncbi:MAG: phosphoserine transaminase, partial [Caulobacteraceae bacterium]
IASHDPPWPLPRIFRLKGADGRIDPKIFMGQTLNTPSLLCAEDWMACLRWAQSVGGLAGLQARANASTKVLTEWVAKSDWCGFLTEDPAIRSNTSVCLRFTDPTVANAPEAERRTLAAAICALLEREEAAYDIASHVSAPPGLRVWCGPTVDADDVAALTPWLDWAYAEARTSL